MNVRQDDGLVLGIDLGGTKILAGVVDSENRVLARAKRSTPAKQGNVAVFEAVWRCAEEAMAAAGVDVGEISAACVGSPGPIDSEKGVILFSANMQVRELPLAAELSRVLGVPAILRNDVRVGAYGEYRLGAGRGYSSLLAAFVGTGIGGCVIESGRIVKGATGNAGEIGHVVVKANGRRCGCGRQGCLEAMASRSAIAKKVSKAIKQGMTSMLAGKISEKGDRIKSRDLAQAFLAGDPLALREVERSARYLGLTIGGLVNLLGPEVVVIGGGVTEAIGAPYVNLVRQHARTQILTDPEGRIGIVPAALGDDAGILGAAIMAREALASG
ncbi:MAG TPA: ROK family protein [Isosphaeraceae bacterium]|nr:ROK family protein [Isosphaeraceae bacterium]